MTLFSKIKINLSKIIKKILLEKLPPDHPTAFASIKPSCAMCKFNGGEYYGLFKCARYPPIVSMVEQEWPIVALTDFCGEFIFKRRNNE